MGCLALRDLTLGDVLVSGDGGNLGDLALNSGALSLNMSSGGVLKSRSSVGGDDGLALSDGCGVGGDGSLATGGLSSDVGSLTLDKCRAGSGESGGGGWVLDLNSRIGDDWGGRRRLVGPAKEKMSLGSRRASIACPAGAEGRRDTPALECANCVGPP
jgi:hypothetical protein